jgi:DNA-binding IclR family transcriptional regulator
LTCRAEWWHIEENETPFQIWGEQAVSAKALERGLQLLDVLAASAEPCGLADLGRRLDMPKTNVFRLVDALARCGYVRRRDDDSRYEATLKLWELGNTVVARATLPRAAAPLLERLAAQTGESAQLAVLDGDKSVYVDKRDGSHPVSGVTRIGTRAPAHCCATGKAELAFQPKAGIDRVASGLQRFTPATIASPKALRAELTAVRAAGVAVNRGEWFEDVWGVAAPLRNHAGHVCASIGVWGPKNRISPRLNDIIRVVKAAAAEASSALGHHQAQSPQPKNSRRSST